MTVHAGVLREHLPFVKDRLIGIVTEFERLEKAIIDRY
jgi:thiamine biosynthesis protein ThiC